MLGHAMTDISSSSGVSPQVDNTAFAEIYPEATELESFDHHQVLQRSLTLCSAISTSSSFTTRSQAATANPNLSVMNHIGEGLQGIVFERVGTEHVYKKEKNNQLGALATEWELHLKIFEAFEKYSTITGEIKVPRPIRYIPTQDEWWIKNQSFFPANHQAPANVIVSQRILPMPKVIRKALVEAYLPQHLHTDHQVASDIINDPRNKHCLLRVYLGRENGGFLQPTANGTRFALQNFPFYLDCMEQLSIDVERFAVLMGQAHAVFNWAAGTTSNDVEFVLGTTATGEEQANFQRRQLHFWVIDFGRCKRVERNMKGLFEMGKGILDNDPYIPTPENMSLWQIFRAAYISTAKSIMAVEGIENLELPLMVMDGIEAKWSSM